MNSNLDSKNSSLNSNKKFIFFISLIGFLNASFILPQLPSNAIQNKTTAVCTNSHQMAAMNSLKASLMQGVKVPNAGTAAVTSGSC